MKLPGIILIFGLLVLVVTAAFAAGGPVPAPATRVAVTQTVGCTPYYAKAAFAAKCRVLRHRRMAQYFRLKRAFITKSMGFSKADIDRKGMRQGDDGQ